MRCHRVLKWGPRPKDTLALAWKPRGPAACPASFVTSQEHLWGTKRVKGVGSLCTQSPPFDHPCQPRPSQAREQPHDRTGLEAPLAPTSKVTRPLCCGLGASSPVPSGPSYFQLLLPEDRTVPLCACGGHDRTRPGDWLLWCCFHSRVRPQEQPLSGPARWACHLPGPLKEALPPPGMA